MRMQTLVGRQFGRLHGSDQTYVYSHMLHAKLWCVQRAHQYKTHSCMACPRFKIKGCRDAMHPPMQPAKTLRMHATQLTKLQGRREPGAGERHERGLVDQVENDVEGVPARRKSGPMHI